MSDDVPPLSAAPAADPARCPQCGAPLPEGAPQGLCPACLLKQGFATQTNPTGAAASSGQPMFVPPTQEELAAHFPQLEILELIGQGGMGAVYKARQPTLDRLVALKILPPQTAARDPGFAERFNREARALARLSHPRIVHVHDFGQAGGFYYFLMEYVDGANLRQLERAGKLEPREALAIVPQICEALQYAHDQGIVHRDIKPENILVSKQGQIKIADFGVAKLIGAEASPITLTHAGQIMGTPLYMAPEQVEKPSTVDHRADIYSLGVVFYEMLTGELPLGRFPAPSRKVQIDVRLDEVVFRTLEKEPELRYQRAGEVKTEVESIASTPRREAAAAPIEHNLLHLEGITRFQSITALRVAYFACLGFLGFLGYLPGWERMFGAFGLFGLMGVAFVVEVFARSRTKRTGGASPPADENSGAPRFSRRALVGVVWAGCAVAAFLMFFTHARQTSESHEPSWWQYALSFTLLPLGLTAPLGTTILGWVAVAQIRRSAGRIYGLWLAVFDGLLFPLAALDCGITLLIFSFGVGFLRWSRFYSDEQNSKLIFLSGIAWVIVDALIFWLVWRAVNKPIDGSAPAPAPTASQKSSPPTAAAQDERRRFGMAVTGFVMLAALAVFGAIFLGPTFLARGGRSFKPVSASALAAPAVRIVPQPPYVARLPYGATVELTRITEHLPQAEGDPGPSRQWWEPNGNGVVRPWFYGKGSQSYPSKDQVAREFYLRLSDLPPGADSWPEWQFEPTADYAVGSVVEEETGKSTSETAEGWRMVSAKFPNTARTVNVRVGFGLGPWDTVTQQTPNGGSELQGFNRDGRQWTVSFLRATETGDGATKITAVHNVKDRQVRVVAVDAAGVEHVSQHTEGMGTDAFVHHTVTFDNLPLAQIKEFRFQVRSYSWVEFRNVSLREGQRSTVGIVDNADPDPSPRTPFAARLPQGAAVEIAGIGYHPSGAQPWWNADGSPLERKDWEAQSNALAVNGNRGDLSAFRQIVLHADGPGEKPAIVGFSFKPSAKDIEFGSDGGFDVLRNGQVLPSLQWQGLIEQFKPDQTTATVKVEVGVGPYEPLPSANMTRFGDQAMAARFRGKRVVLGKLFEREGQAAISFTLDIWEDRQWRLRAQDNDGQWHEGKTVDGQSSSGLLQAVMAFEGLRVRDVKQVAVETRPTYKAEFRNVSLKPGQKTEVAVVSGAEQAAPDKYGPMSDFQRIAPYPETTLTPAWDGSKHRFPDPLAYLTALRTTDEYREWQGRKDDRYFRDENAAGYHFEAHVTGMGNRQMNGGMDELIPTVKIFRPQGGLVASAQLGRLYADNWDVDVYDDAGQKVVTRLRWIREIRGTYIAQAVFNPDTPQESTWFANQYGVVYSDGKEHQLREYETQPYPLPFPPAVPTPAVSPTFPQEEQRAMLRLQLQQAEKEAAEAERQQQAGMRTVLSVQEFKDKAEVLRAMIEGDAVHVAEVKLNAATQRLNLAQKLVGAGVKPETSEAEIRNQQEQARLELQQAKTRAASPMPSESPAPSPSPVSPAPTP